MKIKLITLSVFILVAFFSHSKVSFVPDRSHTQQEKEIVVVAEKLANDLLNSSCFEHFMMKRNLINTNGMTAAQVVSILRTSNISVPVHMYTNWFVSTVGYRVPPKPDVYTNRKFHSGATACSRSSNLTHEWSHVVGFDHSAKPNPQRPYSVPYSINAAFLQCCSCVGKSLIDCSIR